MNANKRVLLLAIASPILVGCAPKMPKPRGQFSVERTVIDRATVWAPIAGGAHPLLLLLPGMGNAATDYTVIAEDLASFGLVIAGISPDSVPLDLERRAEMQPVVDRWSSLAIRVLDRMESDPRVNKARVGVFGHSFGGAVAVHLLQTEGRFQRGANMDGALQGRSVGNLTRPLMILNGAPLPPSQQALNDRILAEMKAVCNSDSAGCEWREYSDAEHGDFSDKALRTLDGTHFLHKVSDDLLRFFSRL